ncbi:MAG TPA: SRPBCC family protein [Acidimicrobiales bacterium]|nr:SRPBCC family protein [Acidimicrobiales bacterium]
MAEVREEGELGVGVDEAWKLVGDFGGFVQALGVPVELTGEGIGATRTIRMGDPPTVERLEELDDAAMRLVYSIVSGPLPVTDYLATMQLFDAGDGRSKLVWTSRFDPAGMADRPEWRRTRRSPS